MAFMAAAAPILGAVGAGMGALGQIQGGMARAAEARYQAQVAENNAIIARQNAGYAIQAGEQRAYDVGLRERARAGHMTAELAAGGIDVNTGSAAKVRETQQGLGTQSQLTTMQDSLLQAYGYRTQATSFEAQQRLYQAEAPQDILGGILGGGGALLSGASNVGFKWAGMQNNPYGGATTGGAPTGGELPFGG
jgi:hypothetical protein